jgi:predicted SAM-dependent methyltransferase
MEGCRSGIPQVIRRVDEVSYQLPFKEGDRVVELGGGEHPILLPKITMVNVDVRQVPNVDIVRNLEEDFSDIGQFDGLIAQYLIEHIGWRKLGVFLKSCFNVLKANSYAVFVMPDTEEQMKLALENSDWDLGVSQMIFGDQNYGDNAHKSAFSKTLISKLLRDAGFSTVKITPHPDPKARDMFVEAYKKGEVVTSQLSSVLKYNFGSFIVMFKDWNNVDVLDLHDYAKKNGYIFQQMDCSKPLNLQSNQVDYINSDHMLEHLDREAGKRFLSECLRVLKVGGVARIGVPDERLIASKFVRGEIMSFSTINEGVKNAMDEADAFYRLSNDGHITFYDLPSLTKAMQDAGFKDIVMVEHKKSKHKELDGLDERFPELTLYVEGTKGEVDKSELQRFLDGEITEGSN